eukprot:SAG11_NODE_9289_length_925_cov_1.237288_2_plen_81_part_00
MSPQGPQKRGWLTLASSRRWREAIPPLIASLQIADQEGMGGVEESRFSFKTHSQNFSACDFLLVPQLNFDFESAKYAIAC